MYVIEIIIKNTPMPLSVQRKTLEDAKSVYQQVLSSLQSGANSLLELTCERQPEKQIAVMTGDIVAVQMYEKSGAASSGKTPGFAVSFTES
jgi:Ni2+-binding GTPase involved in maturation of urease and hydrogenase